MLNKYIYINSEYSPYWVIKRVWNQSGTKNNHTLTYVCHTYSYSIKIIKLITNERYNLYSFADRTSFENTLCNKTQTSRNTISFVWRLTWHRDVFIDPISTCFAWQIQHTIFKEINNLVLFTTRSSVLVLLRYGTINL